MVWVRVRVLARVRFWVSGVLEHVTQLHYFVSIVLLRRYSGVINFFSYFFFRRYSGV